jgi:hypothetical protein
MLLAFRFLAFVILLTGTIACGDDPVDPTDLPVCSTPITVTASADTAPVLRWKPACRASYLNVSEAIDPGRVAWAVYSAEAMLTPGMRYGVALAGSQVLTAARALGRDTSYVISIGHAIIGADFASTSALGGTSITACGAMSGGRCQTTPERFSEVTAEGVRIVASASRTAVSRGDTTWLSFGLVNPTAHAITIQTRDTCWTTRVDATRPGPARFILWSCDSPFAAITVPANGVVERRIPFTGLADASPYGVSCQPVGTWAARMWVNATVGGRRVRSPEITWRLVEREAVRAVCVGDA